MNDREQMKADVDRIGMIVSEFSCCAPVNKSWQRLRARLEAMAEDTARLDYIERTFSGMTNRERYLPVVMGWGKGFNGRTLREACDKYRNGHDVKKGVAADAAIAAIKGDTK